MHVKHTFLCCFLPLQSYNLISTSILASGELNYLRPSGCVSELMRTMVGALCGL